ncbi:hypothetical protein ACHAXM_001903 [Skeletonema potamos]
MGLHQTNRRMNMPLQRFYCRAYHHGNPFPLQTHTATTLGR